MKMHTFAKRFVSAVLLVCMVMSFVGCNDSSDTQNTDSSTETPSATDNVLLPGESPDAGEDAIWDEEDWESEDDNTSDGNEDVIVGDVVKSGFDDSIVYADSVANKIKAVYTDGNRVAYKVSNIDNILTEKLVTDDTLGSTLKNKNRATYFKDSLDVYAIDDNGDELSVSPALSNAKINTTKLGYYYYDVNVRDIYLGYVNGVSYPLNGDLDLSPDKWHTNDMQTPVKDANGLFSVEVASSYDPFFYMNDLSADGRYANALEITIKTDKDTTSAALYYYTSDKVGFNGEQVTVFSIRPDGEFHTYLVPMDNFGKNIEGVRIDIGSVVGEKVTVKRVRFAYMKQVESPVAAEKTFHSYPEKLHFEASLHATSESLPVKNITEYGYKVSFPKSSVVSMTLGINGSSAQPELYKVYKNPEYIGFDIKNTGVVGFIIPNDNSQYGLKISETGDVYNVYIFKRISEDINFASPVSLCSRIYTDSTHSFDGIKKVAKQERNPFTHITVSGNRGGRFVGYDYASGSYTFTVNGTDFNTAYKTSGQNVYYFANITVTASDDRVVYVSMKTSSGGLEGAAIATRDGVSLPIPIEVCKNFKGEIEEPLYDPNDDSYGYSILPINASKNKKYEFTLYHLYQNWGKYPIKQISSIAFHVSYYHLSTGVTESNCIAPYYVYGKDGWTLPDFRGASGEMWSTQPQYNSVGRVYFTKHKDKDGNFVLSEYTGSDINSSGNTYADMTYSYIADDGAYEYDLRHFELPQTDENRTMYQVSLEFLKDTSFADVKNDLSIFSFDGRSVTFEKASFLNENNKKQVVINKNDGVSSDIYVLGKENPYFSFYDFEYNGNDTTSGMNFGLIVCDSSVTVGGKSWNGNLVFKNEYDGRLNIGTLSFNMGKTTFKKGDKIILTLVLLPYGLPDAKNPKNVDHVIEDIIENPFSLKAEKGTVVSDAFLPSVKCVDNEAVVTVSGGRNNQVVKATGFTKLGVPKIYEKINGKWQVYDYHVKGDYDGYSVHYENGTYSYSFVCDMGNNPQTARRIFKIVI